MFGFPQLSFFPATFSRALIFRPVKTTNYVVHSQPFPKYGLNFMCLQYKSFENTVVKGEITCNEQFLLFPVFFTLFGEPSTIFIKFKIVLCKLFNHFPNKPWFLHVCSKSLLKTLGKGEIAQRAISPFPTVFSTLLENFLPFSLN